MGFVDCPHPRTSLPTASFQRANVEYQALARRSEEHIVKQDKYSFEREKLSLVSTKTYSSAKNYWWQTLSFNKIVLVWAQALGNQSTNTTWNSNASKCTSGRRSTWVVSKRLLNNYFTEINHRRNKRILRGPNIFLVVPHG